MVRRSLSVDDASGDDNRDFGFKFNEKLKVTRPSVFIYKTMVRSMARYYLPWRCKLSLAFVFDHLRLEAAMNEIFSEKVVTSRRTYFFDVKETKEGAKYLVIGELTQVGSELERHRVMVFEESLDSFMHGLDKAVDFILGNEAAEGGDGSARREAEEERQAVENREVINILRRVEKKVDEVREHFK